MSLIQRIRDLASPEPWTNQAGVAADLAVLHALLSGGARDLARHADMAPHEAGARALRAMAGEEEDLARRVLSVLAGSGGPVPLLIEEPPSEGRNLNYWKRLCEDLDAHLRIRNGVELVRRHGAEALPDLTATMEAVARQAERHLRCLRDLIASADSHGLD